MRFDWEALRWWRMENISYTLNEAGKFIIFITV